MGMFDYLKVPVKFLPVNDDEKQKLVNHEWQTKDLDCFCLDAYVDDEGYFYMKREEWEMTPEDKKPYPNHKGILGIIGCITPINQRYELYNFSDGDVVYFYDDNYEFLAHIKDNKIESVEQVSEF